VWREGHSSILAYLEGSTPWSPMQPAFANIKHRMLDPHAFFRSVLDAVFAPAIVRFLRFVFERHPICTQTLGFRKGSESGLHRDTSYVVVDQPMKLAASWIALEDIHPGSGVLELISGGHRIPEYLYSGQFKHWNPSRDTVEDHQRYHRAMTDDARKMGLALEAFVPKRGDVLIWSADLPHGGSTITDPNLTRKSLVAHYCPSDCRPNYFEHTPDKCTMKEAQESCYYSSWYYNLNELPAPV
jgi:ectoine hydroxylase-related dioxygenase (phytanoyl-CoA dioxygenase family)